MATSDAIQQVPYRLIQLEWEAKKGYTNEPVENFDGLERLTKPRKKP
ncbi:hypothetical protein [Xanthomonas dyei]|nr:hypothetical protein [Xanthomonas dyei]